MGSKKRDATGRRRKKRSVKNPFGESHRKTLHMLESILKRHARASSIRPKSTVKDITAIRQSASKVMAMADEAVKQRVFELQNAAIACDQTANQVAAAEAAVVESIQQSKYAIMVGRDPAIYQQQMQQKQEELVAKIDDAKQAASTVQVAGAALDTVAPANPEALSLIARMKNGASNILSKHGKTIATAALVTAGLAVAYRNRENIGDYLQTAKATYWDAPTAAMPTAEAPGFYANLKQQTLDAVGNARARATQYLNPIDAGTYNARPGIDPGTYYQEDNGWLAKARQPFAAAADVARNAKTRATQYLNPIDAGTYNAHPGIDPGTYFQEDKGWLARARQTYADTKETVQDALQQRAAAAVDNQLYAADAATRKNRIDAFRAMKAVLGGARTRRR